MVNILVVEDDLSIQQTLVSLLKHAGYAVETADSLSTAREKFDALSPTLVVLDVGLPDGSGYALAAQWRAVSDVGIIILTGRSDVEDQVLGMNLGADHYLIKPVDPRSLMATIQSLLSRLKPIKPSAPVLHSLYDPDQNVGWILDSITWRLRTQKGHSIALTGKEYVLLKTLSDANGQHVPRQALTERLGGGVGLNAEKAMNVLISRLRRKVTQETGLDLPLKTLRSHGYAFPGLRIDV